VAVVFTDGTRLARSGLLVATTLHQRSQLVEQLGVGFDEPTPAAANPIAVDALCRTTVPGVFAAGDTSSGAQMPQLASAIATGSLAAASLLAEDTAQRDHRHQRDPGNRAMKCVTQACLCKLSKTR
jgi:thioredoxin reductase